MLIIHFDDKCIFTNNTCFCVLLYSRDLVQGRYLFLCETEAVNVQIFLCVPRRFGGVTSGTGSNRSALFKDVAKTDLQNAARACF